MKYIPIDKLIAEIERLKGLLIRGACAAQIEMETNCKDEAYNEILSFITYFQQEQHPLPSNLDEATEEIVKDWNAYGDGEYKKLVIAGAEWMAGQGETFNGFVSARGNKRSLIAIEGSYQNFKFGKEVIVQIRKKEE